MAVERPVWEGCGDRFHKGEQLRFANRFWEYLLANDIVREMGSKSVGIFLFPGLYGSQCNSCCIHYTIPFSHALHGVPFEFLELAPSLFKDDEAKSHLT